jgi:coenzyme F420-0:L-glutamate ligase / coenzyme F420-1:gamma-L-glutamate ligase
VRLRRLTGIPEVHAGTTLPALLSERAAAEGVVPGDVLVVAHKVVSKAEGAVVRLAEITPGAAARALAEETGKDPRLCEVILAESRRIVRRRGGIVVCETHHGFVCANAGIDASNVPEGYLVLLPRDPDRSARHMQTPLAQTAAGRVGVVIADTHGRAFRRGIINVAIGVAGFRGVVDHRGRRDREGRVLVATEQALADELAAAAGILMDKAGGFPAILVSDVDTEWAVGGVGELLRDPAHDLFRGGEDPEEGV